jgi:hypothetical protein
VDALLGHQLSNVPTAQRTQACRQQEHWTTMGCDLTQQHGQAAMGYFCWGSSSVVSKLHSTPKPAMHDMICLAVDRQGQQLTACIIFDKWALLPALLGLQFSDIPAAQLTQACRQEQHRTTREICVHVPQQHGKPHCGCSAGAPAQQCPNCTAQPSLQAGMGECLLE